MPGTYEVIITDSKGCIINKSVTVGDDCVCPSPLINQNMVTNARCGEANGFIMIMVNGPIENFQFQWSPDTGTPGAYNNERTSLPAGTYDVTVSYANKAECTEVVRLVVGNKDGVSGSVSSNIPAKCDENNGQVILTPGVSYFWEDGSQSQDRSNLAPGTYSIKTLDPSGCEGALLVTVGREPCDVTCTLAASIDNITTPDCDGNLGSININASGGKAPYTYTWNISAIGNVASATSLIEGSYTVEVRDADGCTVNLMATLDKPDCTTPPTPPNPDNPPTSNCNITLSLNADNLTCDGDNSGAIGVNVFNGQPPYTYKWSNGETTSSIAGLSVGDYWVEVIDANGCRKNSTIQISSPGRLVVTETRTVLDCEQVEIKLNVRNGRAPYKWECDGLTGSLLDPLTLSPGSYNCVITDGSGCTVTHVLEMEDYQPLNVTEVVKNTTCGEKDGSIDLTPSGGTSPYTFEWDCGLFKDEDQFNLGPHTYNVTITDATNCFIVKTYTISDCGGKSFSFSDVSATSLGDQSVEVKWTTENEVSLGNYVVLHSVDGEQFQVVGEVMEGSGPVQSANYGMKELANFGRNFYQIKYIDANGEEFFSEVVDVVVFLAEGTGRASIPAIIYPNPTHSEFTLDFASPIEAKITVTITDLDGVVLKTVELEPGTPKRIFDVMTYDAGIYLVTLQQRRKKLISYRLVKALD